MNGEAGSTHNVNGTPTFLLNGDTLEERTWAALEPKIKDAL